MKYGVTRVSFENLPNGEYVISLIGGWKHGMARVKVDIEGEPEDKIDALFGQVFVFTKEGKLPGSWSVRFCPSPIEGVVDMRSVESFQVKLGALQEALGVQLTGDLKEDATIINDRIREKGEVKIRVYGWGTVTEEKKFYFNIQRIIAEEVK